MGADYKSVRLTEEVYEALKRRKRAEESFSDVVERLARERPIRDLAGLFTDEEVESIRTERSRHYDEYAERREREREE